MLSKTDRRFLRKLFERFIEAELEKSIYKEEEYLKIDFLTCPTLTKVLTFDPKEVEKVISKLEKEGYKVDVESPKQIITLPRIHSQSIKIYL